MAENAPVTKQRLLEEMDAVWREFDALLAQFADKLDTRMPIDGPAWTGRQFLGHLLGAIQSTPYYLMQPREGGVVETVIGDPYWRQIYATATLASFHAMLFAAHTGTVQLIQAATDEQLRMVGTFPNGHTATAIDVIWFNYHVHLRSHVADLRQWVNA